MNFPPNEQSQHLRRMEKNDWADYSVGESYSRELLARIQQVQQERWRLAYFEGFFVHFCGVSAHIRKGCTATEASKNRVESNHEVYRVFNYTNRCHDLRFSTTGGPQQAPKRHAARRPK
jgi:hypothetical protein